MLLRDMEPVEPVGIGPSAIRAKENGFPGSVIFFLAVGDSSLHNDGPGTSPPPIIAAEHLQLPAFDVHLEKVPLLGRTHIGRPHLLRPAASSPGSPSPPLDPTFAASRLQTSPKWVTFTSAI